MDSQAEFETLHLARSLNGAGLAALAEALLDRRGAALNLDASEVDHVGAQCLQVLISARNTWSNDRKPLKISDSSKAFTHDLELLGVPVDQLEVGIDQVEIGESFG